MSETFLNLLPATLLAVFASFLFLGGTGKNAKSGMWGVLSLVALGVAGVTLAFNNGAFGGTIDTIIVQDALSVGVHAGTIVIGMILVLTMLSSQSTSESSAEFYAMLLLILAGVMVVASANDLVLLFLALELISVPTYVLLYTGRSDHRSQEACVKYFLLSILSAAVLLYGLSFVYGLTGSTNISAIRQVLNQAYGAVQPGVAPGGGSVLGLVAMVLIFAGLGFKVAAVPFHFYAPDVYQGTTAFNAGLLSIIPKAAGFIALMRLGISAMVGFERAGESIALILALITMTSGNCLALLQNNIRRMMAYSGIAHAGYLLIGMAVGFWDTWNPAGSLDSGTGLPGGVRAAMIYLAAYSIATAGLFAALVYLPRNGKQIEDIDDLTGLVRSQPWVAVCMAIFLFSLAGVPPLPGFWGKLGLFFGALGVRDGLGYVQSGFMFLAVAGVINAAIGAVYYLRIVAVMFLNDPLSVPSPEGGKSAHAAVSLSAVLVLLMGILPGPLFTYASSVSVRTSAVETAPATPVVSSAPAR